MHRSRFFQEREHLSNIFQQVKHMEGVKPIRVTHNAAEPPSHANGGRLVPGRELIFKLQDFDK
jgi:hypothetical protein